MALSQDLRERVLHAYEKGEGSIRGLAKRFAIGSASVWRLLRQYKVEGNINAKSPPGRSSCLGKKEKKVIAQLVQKDKDATLKELCRQFKAKTRIKVSLVTMHKVCKQLKLTYKKNLVSG